MPDQSFKTTGLHTVYSNINEFDVNLRLVKLVFFFSLKLSEYF